MTAVLNRVPVEQISEQARQIRAGRALLTLLAGVFFLLGWLAGKMLLGFAWCVAAVKVGWQEARKAQSRGPAR